MRAGEPGIFTANVKGLAKGVHPIYLWSVSIGEVIDGQGTKRVRVVHNTPYATPTVTVEVHGFPEGCPAMDSETTPFEEGPQITLIANNTGLGFYDLKEFTPDLKNNPNADLAIVVELAQNDDVQKVKTLLEQTLKKQSTVPDVDVSRFHFVLQKGTKRWTKVFLVPPGAAMPACETDKKTCIEFVAPAS